MSFSLTGTVIIQSGTDTDLSGLNGLAGVTVTQHNPTGGRPYTSYRLANNYRLRIDGDLTITPEKEILILERGVNYGGVIKLHTNSAHLRIEDTRNTNGTTTYQRNCAIRFTGIDTANGFWATVPTTGIWFDRGNFTQNGGVIFGSTSHTWDVNFGTTYIRNGAWDGNSISGVAYNEIVLHIRGAGNFDVDGWDLTTFQTSVAADPTGSTFANVTYNSSQKGWATGGSPVTGGFPAGKYLTLKNYQGRDMGGDASVWISRWSKFINSADLKVVANNPNNNGSKGLVEEQYDVTLKVRDLAQTVQQGVKAYTIDNNNSGIRTNWTITTPNINYTNDRVYNGTSDVNGEIDLDILVAVTVATTNQAGLYPKDVRFTNRSVPIQFCGYEYGLSTFNFDASGYLADERHVINQFMLPDTLITESNQATVSAYTTLDSAQQVYDRAKDYLYTNYAGETSTILSRSGNQVDIGSTNLIIDATAASVFAYSTDVTIKSSTFTGGVAGTGSVTIQNGVVINGGVFNSDVIYNQGPSTIYNANIDNLEITQAGTYYLEGVNIGTVTNTSGGSVVLELDANSSVATNGGPNITIQTPPTEINLTNIQAGSQVVIYQSGTTTELFRSNSSTGTEQYIDTASSVNFDLTVQKAGFFPVRQSNLTATSSAATNIAINQLGDRAYVASSGLNAGNVTVDTTNKTIDTSTTTTVQNLYSYLIETWISDSLLRNKEFPMTTFGSSSFSLDLDYEFTAPSISRLSRDGFRYTNSGNVKAIYAAVLSQGVTAGLQAEYVQTQGGTVVDVQNTGDVDQVIKIFGDANNGNFDYRDHLVFKVQANGYRQAEFDVVDTYGTLEATLYVIGLTTLPISGLTIGAPTVSGLTVTDNTAAPVAWDAGDGVSRNYSITITDTNSNTGNRILRYFNHLLSTDGTINGLDVFQYPELIIDNGAAYETLTGIFRKATGDTTVGVRVIDGSGNPHPEFTRFQSDDGSYGVVPVYSYGAVTNLVSGSRIQVYNVTTSTEVVNMVVNSTSYNVQYLDGNDYTNGDTLRIRVTYKNGTSAKLGFSAQTLVSASGWSVVADQKDDTVYGDIGVDGSTITIFEADYVDTEIDLIVSQNFGSNELYPWWVDNLYTADGIRYFFDGIVAEDIANYRIDANTVDLMFDTDVSTNVYQNNDARIYRSDAIYPVKAPTTGGGAIDLVWRQRVFVAEVGTSGLTAAEAATLNKIDDIEKLAKLIPASL
jgi:hypothetical protein